MNVPVYLDDTSEGDLPYLYRLAHTDHAITRWRLGGRTISPTRFVKFIWEDTSANWLVRRTSDSRPIGLVQIFHEDCDRRSAEIGLLLDPEWRGVAGWGALMGVDRAFRELSLQRISFRMLKQIFQEVQSVVERLPTDCIEIPDGCWWQGARHPLIVGQVRRERWEAVCDQRGGFVEVIAASPDPTVLQRLIEFDDSDTASLFDVIGDSLDLLELVAEVEQLLGRPLPDELVASWLTVDDVMSLIRASTADGVG
jgi:acyl carrier protein